MRVRRARWSRLRVLSLQKPRTPKNSFPKIAGPEMSEAITGRTIYSECGATGC